MITNDTIPIDNPSAKSPTANVIAHHYRDPITGMQFIHKDMVEILEPHPIMPPTGDTALADAKSWVHYITRYGNPSLALLTWNDRRMKAILDYHKAGHEQAAGRAEWSATYAYPFTPIFSKWDLALGGDGRLSHEGFVELMERTLTYITESEQADSALMMDTISTMRVTRKSHAESTYNSDGSTDISWHRQEGIRGSKEGQARLPQTIEVSIPFMEQRKERMDFEIRLRPRLGKDDEIVIFVESDDFAKNRDGLLKAHADEIAAQLGDFGDIPILHIQTT